MQNSSLAKTLLAHSYRTQPPRHKTECVLNDHQFSGKHPAT